MQVCADSASIFDAYRSALGSELGDLLGRRIEELAMYGEEDLFALIKILVLEPCDGLEAVDAELGFSLLGRRCDVAESHQGWFELTLVLSDDGSGVVVYVPKHSGTEPGLLDYCASQMEPLSP